MNPIRAAQTIIDTAKRYRNFPAVAAARSRHLPPQELILWNGDRFAAPPVNELEFFVQEIYFRKDYTPPGFEVRPGDTIVDIGANFGVFSVKAARVARRVIAVEASPLNAEYLRRNIEQNRLSNVTIVNEAVAAATGTLSLYRSPYSGGHTLLDSSVNGAKTEFDTVPAAPLEDILDRCHVAEVDLLKCDCEGAEGVILPSLGPEVMSRIRRIAMEYHDDLSPLSHGELANLLKTAGFSVRVVEGTDHPQGLIYAKRPPKAS